MAGDAKSKKAGRNEGPCKAYKNGQRRDINGLRKLIKHLQHQGFWSRSTGTPSNRTPLDAREAWLGYTARLSNLLIKQVLRSRPSCLPA